VVARGLKRSDTVYASILLQLDNYHLHQAGCVIVLVCLLVTPSVCLTGLLKKLREWIFIIFFWQKENNRPKLGTRNIRLDFGVVIYRVSQKSRQCFIIIAIITRNFKAKIFTAIPSTLILCSFARDSIYAKRAYAIAIPSLRPPVCHTGGSVKNGWS